MNNKKLIIPIIFLLIAVALSIFGVLKEAYEWAFDDLQFMSSVFYGLALVASIKNIENKDFKFKNFNSFSFLICFFWLADALINIFYILK